MSYISLKYVKWFSAALTLTGILLFYSDVYPYNMIPHSLGVIGWTIIGFKTKDKPLLTNFSLQIPFIIIGAINVFFNFNIIKSILE
ncbi:MAG: hypothetical protein ACJ0G8_02920 [Dehalococcoidia bacterium]